ncbi:cysteine--tRNA ligase [Sphingomonas sp.]|uniref:cysteine--tRNA ligase n=1 Tax=Sphingomonas sp. TaxID=28214 RepID=UPI002DB5FB4D|nr:cysteine--tRNA ligase [Sphingomonas sp.]HEU4967692.1 cysteine--tRNA ligase [Sphingomonas sp.]
MVPLRLFNSLTRSIETFEPVHPGEARVYTCGPTVYNFQHVGNMRAYVFADTLGRVLSFKGYKLHHIINITDVGHLTSDADEGADKMETAAAKAGKSAWDIARFYTDAYWRDIERLNIRQPATWSIATEYVPAMIDFAKSIEANCYQLPSGLYFDTATVPEYGRLARSKIDEGESRIEPVEGKRHPTDFAIWRATPPGETRQMEWDSPWGRGAPGWHLECSVMSEALLGFPFDIHTGGIDHREIHHPNEIAQNQARCHSADSGARIWMHNNFLIDRGGKMSKSKGEFLTLQALVDRGFHPLAYRLMCLQAHYRSELEFTFENLAAAFTRLKRMIMAAEKLPDAETAEVTDKRIVAELAAFDEAVSDDLNTAKALTHFETALTTKGFDAGQRRAALAQMDAVLGLKVLELSRAKLRLRPADTAMDEPAIETRLLQRKEARAAKDFATSDRIRDELAAAGVEVMDGDPLGWDWKLAC